MIAGASGESVCLVSSGVSRRVRVYLLCRRETGEIFEETEGNTKSGKEALNVGAYCIRPNDGVYSTYPRANGGIGSQM